MGNQCARGSSQEATTTNVPHSTVDLPEQRETGTGSCQEEHSITVEELRRQRLRLSLDIEGEQLPSLKEASGSKIPLPYEKKSKQFKRQVSSSKNGRVLPSKEGSRLSLDEVSAQTEVSAVVHKGASANTFECASNGAYEIAVGTECKLKVSYAACSHAGWEPVRELRSKEQLRKENQDSFYLEVPFDTREDEALFAVFDGHGANGKTVAEFIRDQLPRQIKESLKLFEEETCSNQEEFPAKNLFFSSPDEVVSEAYCELMESTSLFNLVRSIIRGFLNCSKALLSLSSDVDISMSGTTAVVAWIKGSFLFCCNVGDSRCVIGRQMYARKSKYIAVEMTCDQKPSRTDEAERIQRCGGRIEYWDSGAGPLRVWLSDDWLPGLAMTRSFGDLMVESIGVISEPEITCMKLSSSDRFCILASDGVWEFMSSREVVNWIGRLRDKYSAQLVAEMLVEEAVKRWRKEDYVVDDVTAIVLWLDYSVEMTNPTVTESGIAESRNLTNEKSSTAEDSDAFGRSFKYLWKIFSADQNKDEVYSVGYAPVIITESNVLKPFSCQNINI